MIPSIEHVILTDSRHTITALGYVGEQAPTGFIVSSLSGFYSMPDLKVTQTERETGNGAFDVEESEVLYAARTVTLGLVVMGDNRPDVMGKLNEVLKFAGRNLRIEVHDGELATYCEGHCRAQVGDTVSDQAATATLTIVCPRPERLSVAAHVATMTPSTGTTDGLQYDGSQVLEWPLNYGEVGESRNGCTLANDGSYTANPRITASGNFPEGFAVYDAKTNKCLKYSQPVTWAGVTLDSRSRTASASGVDVTRYLTSRDFPTVSAGGSTSLFLVANGTGVITCEVRDTYM